MGRGTLGLGVFLGAVVVLIWLQQALTWYYILQRPELAVVEEQLGARLVTGTVLEGVGPLYRPSQRRKPPPPQQSSNVSSSDLALTEIPFRGGS